MTIRALQERIKIKPLRKSVWQITAKYKRQYITCETTNVEAVQRIAVGDSVALPNNNYTVKSAYDRLFYEVKLVNGING